jgi:hypothetical protein
MDGLVHADRCCVRPLASADARSVGDQGFVFETAATERNGGALQSKLPSRFTIP